MDKATLETITTLQESGDRWLERAQAWIELHGDREAAQRCMERAQSRYRKAELLMEQEQDKFTWDLDNDVVFLEGEDEDKPDD
jgi:hypothetical protein